MLTAVVAAAGVLTSATGVQGTEANVLMSSNALVVWGLVAAIGAAVNQVCNPGAASERYLNVKLTLKAIKFNLEYDNISVQEAAHIEGIVVKDPDNAAEELEQLIQARLIKNNRGDD
jgi:hypothetical protein